MTRRVLGVALLVALAALSGVAFTSCTLGWPR